MFSARPCDLNGNLGHGKKNTPGNHAGQRRDREENSQPEKWFSVFKQDLPVKHEHQGRNKRAPRKQCPPESGLDRPGVTVTSGLEGWSLGQGDRKVLLHVPGLQRAGKFADHAPVPQLIYGRWMMDVLKIAGHVELHALVSVFLFPVICGSHFKFKARGRGAAAGNDEKLQIDRRLGQGRHAHGVHGLGAGNVRARG